MARICEYTYPLCLCALMVHANGEFTVERRYMKAVVALGADQEVSLRHGKEKPTVFQRSDDPFSFAIARQTSIAIKYFICTWPTFQPISLLSL